MGKGRQSCSAIGCTNNYNNCSNSFFLFPKENSRARIWAIAAGRHDLINTTPIKGILCSIHFENRMFTSEKQNRLYKWATPTIFPALEGSSTCSFGDTDKPLGKGNMEEPTQLSKNLTTVNTIIVCPYHNCKETFELQSIQHHFTKSHSDSVHLNPYLVMVKREEIRNDSYINYKKDKKLLLLMYENEPYLVFVLSSCTPDSTAEDRILSYNYAFGCFSTNGKDNKSLLYETLLRASSKGSYLSHLKYHPVQQFNEEMHCFDCLLDTCALQHHKKMNNWLQIKYLNIMKEPNMKIEFDIRIFEGKPFEEEEDVASLDSDLDQNLE